MITSEEVQYICKQKYGESTLQIKSPGRANIIGEHTDYNDGCVLPFAIDKGIYFASRENGYEYFRIYATNLNKEVTLYPSQKWDRGFAQFFFSVLNVFKKQDFKVKGLDIVFGGDLPIGAGLSSSSSITCGFIAILNHYSNLGLSKLEMVKLAVESEHGVGVEGGNMDQYSILNGEDQKAMLLDCLSGSSKLINVNVGQKIFVLFNSTVSHNLQDTEYNTRSRTCRSAKEKLKNSFSDIENFRHVKLAHLNVLNEIEQKRVTHVIQENDRVLKAVECLKNDDFSTLGLLINQSHNSLRDLYEVSCPELDFIQSMLSQSNQVLGARMMGGGFGGCVIALLHPNALKSLSITIADAYKQKFDLELEVYPIKPKSGLRIL